MVMVFVVLVGLVIGSFLGALTYRLPKGEGFVKGRSYCDNCGKSLPWFHNIPVFSYLLLNGKSACCGQKISIRYLLIELTSAIGAVVLYLFFGFNTLLATYYILLLLTLAIFIIDLEHQIIPDELSWLVLFLALITNHQSLFVVLFTAFFCSLLLLTIHLVTHGRGMGLGDVKLAIALGAWLTWLNGLRWLMISFIIGGLVAGVLLLLREANLKTKIAFGPFLIIGFWVILIYAKIF